jgi:hypothetical protein
MHHPQDSSDVTGHGVALIPSSISASDGGYCRTIVQSGVQMHVADPSRQLTRLRHRNSRG